MYWWLKERNRVSRSCAKGKYIPKLVDRMVDGSHGYSKYHMQQYMHQRDAVRSPFFCHFVHWFICTYKLILLPQNEHLCICPFVLTKWHLYICPFVLTNDICPFVLTKRQNVHNSVHLSIWPDKMTKRTKFCSFVNLSGQNDKIYKIYTFVHLS